MHTGDFVVNLGGAPTAEERNPALAAGAFIRNFELEYGPSHPAFVEGSYTEVRRPHNTHNFNHHTHTTHTHTHNFSHQPEPGLPVADMQRWSHVCGRPCVGRGTNSNS